MAKDDFYKALLHTEPRPGMSSLSDLLGMAPPVPQITGLGVGSLASLLGSFAAQPAAPTPTGLRFLDSHFSESVAFAYASLPRRPGLYAIVVIDGAWGPRPYRPIYFGKATDLASRVVSSHEKYSEWCRSAGGSEKLYVAHLVMLGSSDSARSASEELLVRHYSPDCNITFNYFANLFGRERSLGG